MLESSKKTLSDITTAKQLIDTLFWKEVVSPGDYGVIEMALWNSGLQIEHLEAVLDFKTKTN